MYYIYILISEKTNKTYVGFSSKNPEERLKEHNNGSNAWTRQNRPFQLKYYESFVCKEDAQNRERFLKSGVGKKLVKLIKEYY